MMQSDRVGHSDSREVRVPRRWKPEYKLRILAEIDAATEKGEVGAILRREGLYSSLISEWRKQRDKGALEALKGKQPGPKVDRVAVENRRLREQNEQLEKRLETLEELVSAQGKVSSLLQEISRKSGDKE
jgi:transposase